MSGPTTDQLRRALEAVLADAKRELEYKRELNEDDWTHLQLLAADFEALPHHNSTQEAMVRVACAYAADMLMHGRTDHAQEMLDMLSRLEQRAQGMNGRTLLALYTYLALVADLADNHLAAAEWAAKTNPYMGYAPCVEVKVCVWLMRGRVEHPVKQRRALLRALRLSRRLDNEKKDLLLKYRGRVALYELYRTKRMPLHRWWHFRKADDLNNKLLWRGLDQDTVFETTRQPLPEPLLKLVDLR